MDEILNDLRARAAEDIRAGFETRDAIIENLTNVAYESHNAALPRRDIARIVDSELLEHYGRQEKWTKPTDCDKLDAAFVALEKQGVVARQNFTCCNTCGRAEIWDEIVKVEEDPVRLAIGYAFYHMQDTERAVGSGAINIKYGATSDSTAEAVGQYILDALLAAGLDASWSGSADDAVQVGLADWRKRRANELPLTDEAE